MRLPMVYPRALVPLGGLIGSYCSEGVPPMYTTSRLRCRLSHSENVITTVVLLFAGIYICAYRGLKILCQCYMRLNASVGVTAVHLFPPATAT